MKKTLLIIGGIGLFCFLLVFRLFFVENTRQTDERKWFVNALRYEFSARVDSVRMLNQHMGRLWCSVIDGDPQTHREDSLKPMFQQHDKLYLIFRHSGDSIIFLVPNGDLVAKGDSVRISSQNNRIEFFRNRKSVASEELSNTLTGFGRPFFLKNK